MKEIKQAQATLAGFQLFVEVFDYVAARQPALVDVAFADVLGVPEKAGPDEISAAMAPRVDAVKAFDPITARIAALEDVLNQVNALAEWPPSANPRIAALCATVMS